MRIVILVVSFLFALFGMPPAKAQPARNWTNTVAMLPGGGVSVGNPMARVQLVEWASYTCSHCATFAREAKPELTALIRSGKVRVEYRTLPRDALDLTAVVLARCGGPNRFLAAHDAIFAQQKAMLDKAEAFAATPPAQQPTATIGKRLEQLADATGLRALLRGHGVDDAQMTRCLNDEAGQKRAIAIAGAAQAAGVDGTPAFEVNGKKVAAHDWATLKPLLTAS
ncbi:thioredoxin domain-containing protein [Sphingomonas sp. 2R-10]|uniref:thioredoxin domain-containing protein n=1 Tax=Sphingomonas sp. 2R-10 TaxID=3045148 RepID=UPI000F79C92E|nr:thioredoxin domain-containing protein [Sphingomonas sp. 2R-10]MDJ0275215.1 thioredoxin domain-containing protein [Sphingomonas sp. 2R-10]